MKRQVFRIRKESSGAISSLLGFLLPILILLAVSVLRGLLLRGDGTVFYASLDERIFGYIRLLHSGSLSSFFSADAETVRLALPFAVSPLNHLLSLIPLSHANTGFALVSFLRCGLAGLTFSLYLRISRKTTALPTVLFSVLYALSSYSVLMQYSISYIDSLIWLPLVMLGAERLVCSGQLSLFAGALAGAFLSNPAAAFPILLFVSLYLIAYSASLPASDRPRLPRLLLSSFCSLALGAMISAAVLIPFFAAWTPSFRELSFVQNFDFMDFLAKMFPGAYDGISESRLPYLAVGVLPLLLIPVYFFSPSIPKRERISFGVLYFVLYFTFSVNVLNAFWNLFVPVAPAYVHSFLFVFLFLATAARSYSVLKLDTERVFLTVSMILAVLLAIIQKLNLTYPVQNEETVTEVGYISNVTFLWLPLFFIILDTGLLSLVLRRGARKSSRRLPDLISVALLLSVCLECFCAASEQIKLMEKNPGFASRSYACSYESAISAGLAVLDKNGLYRTEKADNQTDDDSLLFGYLSSADIGEDALRALGITMDPETGAIKEVLSPASAFLLGIRYYLLREPIASVKEDAEGNPVTVYDEPGSLPSGLESFFETIYQDDAVRVLENDAALPLCFASVGEFLSLSDTKNVYENINRLLRAFTGDNALSVYRPSDVSLSLQHAIVSDTVSHPGYTVYASTFDGGSIILNNTALVYKVSISSDGPLYLSLATDYPRETRLSVNGIDLGKLFEGEEPDAGTEYRCLGTFCAGDLVTVTLRFAESSDGLIYLKNDSGLFWQFDNEALTDASALLSETVSSFTRRENSLRFVVRTESADAPIFTSIAYDNAWRVKLDGKPLETAAALGTFLSFTAGEAGEHTVTISYHPAGKTAGFVASGIGASLLLLLLAAEELLRRGLLRMPRISRKGERK